MILKTNIYYRPNYTTFYLKLNVDIKYLNYCPDHQGWELDMENDNITRGQLPFYIKITRMSKEKTFYWVVDAAKRNTQKDNMCIFLETINNKELYFVTSKIELYLSSKLYLSTLILPENSKNYKNHIIKNKRFEEIVKNLGETLGNSDKKLLDFDIKKSNFYIGGYISNYIRFKIEI